MSDSVDRIFRAASNDYLERVSWIVEYFREKVATESPIEELFLIGLVTACNNVHSEYGLSIGFGQFHAEQEFGVLGIGVDSQVKVGGKRVDFALKFHRRSAMLDGDVLQESYIAVECDGKAYHHGDPVAAARDKARDRVLAEHFDAILRFTGSELHADAYSCAKQAIRVGEAKLR